MIAIKKTTSTFPEGSYYAFGRGSLKKHNGGGPAMCIPQALQNIQTCQRAILQLSSDNRYVRFVRTQLSNDAAGTASQSGRRKIAPSLAKCPGK
jgi:hypothetical protein